MMLDSLVTITGRNAVIAVMAALFAAMSSGSANAQAIRCENIAFTEERIACYYYRASVAPGPSCLFFCPPQMQPPVKRVKHRRARR